MMKLVVLAALITTSAMAYVPTVESLFRHGPNPDVTANGVSITMVVRKAEAGAKPQGQESALVNETKSEDFYKMFFTKVSNDVMKVAQTRYENNTFSEASLMEKVYFSNFSPYTVKGSMEESEKGVFHAMLRSMIFNDGHYLVNYLKSLGVPVKLNSEIINREKVEYLASYKQYLVAVSKDRRKAHANPLKPEDAGQRAKIDAVMNEPMYVDQKQVKLSREDGDMSWLITAGHFDAVVSYKDREITKIKYRSQLGEYEIQCKDFWLANGTHSMPRYILVKDYKGENYQIEILNLRHYLEKEVDLVNRLKKWDSLLKGKESTDPKPPFVL